MGRPPCCDKSNVKRGLWTAEEDAKILAYVSSHGTGNWTSVPKKAGLKRCGKSCRLRYTNYLRPDIKRESFTPEEEAIIIDCHSKIGSRWSVIAQQLPGRTDNDVKNYWNTKLKKKLFQKGIDPITHKPISYLIESVRRLPHTCTTIFTTGGETSNPASVAQYHHHAQKDQMARISSLNRDLKNIFMSRPPSDLANVASSSSGAVLSGTGTTNAADHRLPGPNHDAGTYDLLSQLRAIKMVTAGCTEMEMIGTTAPAPVTDFTPATSFYYDHPCSPCCSSASSYFAPWEDSPSCSSSAFALPPTPPHAAATADEPTPELHWSDFLVDDVVLCIQEEDTGVGQPTSEGSSSSCCSSSNKVVAVAPSQPAELEDDVGRHDLNAAMGDAGDCFDGWPTVGDEGQIATMGVEGCDADASFVESFLSRDSEMVSWEFAELLGAEDPCGFMRDGGV